MSCWVIFYKLIFWLNFLYPCPHSSSTWLHNHCLIWLAAVRRELLFSVFCVRLGIKTCPGVVCLHDSDVSSHFYWLMFRQSQGGPDQTRQGSVSNTVSILWQLEDNLSWIQPTIKILSFFLTYNTTRINVRNKRRWWAQCFPCSWPTELWNLKCRHNRDLLTLLCLIFTLQWMQQHHQPNTVQANIHEHFYSQCSWQKSNIEN